MYHILIYYFFSFFLGGGYSRHLQRQLWEPERYRRIWTSMTCLWNMPEMMILSTLTAFLTSDPLNSHVSLTSKISQRYWNHGAVLLLVHLVVTTSDLLFKPERSSAAERLATADLCGLEKTSAQAGRPAALPRAPGRRGQHSVVSMGPVL